VNQTEQKVFGTDVVVVEHACLFLGKHHNAPSSIGKAFKHLRTPCIFLLIQEYVERG